MIPRGFKKKSNKSPPSKKDTIKTSTKSKSKPKPKKKINPTQYLQALIDLQNTNCSTTRKKKSTKRDISSALTVATPALQKTISSTKIRSKSSFSHYKKKSSIEHHHPETVTMNICAVITQESNVQYTQKTARSSTNEKNQMQQLKMRCLEVFQRRNQHLAALKIQRAWRNYQTFKMVSQHYEIEKRIERQGKNFQDKGLTLNIRKSDGEKTLRIKKSYIEKKKQRKNQELSQTNKIIMQRYKQASLELEGRNSISRMRSVQESRITQKTHLSCLEELKQKQVERINETIDFIESNSRQKTKEEILDQLMKKIEQNKRVLEEDFKKKLQIISMEKNMNKKQEQLSASREIQSSAQNITSQLEKSEIKSIQNIDIRSFLSEESNFGYELQSVNGERDEMKVFEYRMQQIKSDRNKHLKNIEEAVENGSLSVYLATQKKEKVQFQYESERKQIEKNRKQYIFSLTKLKNNALKCHGWLLKQSNSLKKLRKSFSAGTTVLKNVLEEIKIDELSEYQFGSDFIDSLFNPIPMKQIKESPLLNTPIRSEYEGNKQSDISSALENSTQIMKEYSEQIQQRIEKYLFDQIVYQIYKNQNMFEVFKPYVGQSYQFPKITDQQILEYLSQLKKVMPHETKILKRVNQKINPTTIQILRIIRDFQFEIQEYELIIPEEAFKKYRQSLEKQYKNIQAFEETTKEKLEQLISDEEVLSLVKVRDEQRREKKTKYRNFERDLKIMYMKAVFNCLNEYFIEMKSLNSFMNSRSSIGPGQLKFAIKEFNEFYDLDKFHRLQEQVQSKLTDTLKLKCSIPSFKNYADLQRYQQEVMAQIKNQSNQNEYKWVNYMDQILQIWQDLSVKLTDSLIEEAVKDFLSIL